MPISSKRRTALEQQVKHLSWLLDDLLDVSRLTRGKIALRKETVTLQTIVAEALESAARCHRCSAA